MGHSDRTEIAMKHAGRMDAAGKRYRPFSLTEDMEKARNYLTSMVDERLDFLPYWLIGINENPAWAQHCRVDDAELVASWHEGLACCMEVLASDKGSDVLDGFRRHLLKSWGEHGLRFHEPYPWSHTQHSSFHEMGYVLSALVRISRANPDDREIRSRMDGLINGMRELVVPCEVRTFWAGDFPFQETVHRFPNDVYLRGKGWDLTRVTGRGEEAIRNAVVMHPLAQAYELTGNEMARDLAVGLANHLLGISHYFNHRREFFGHVHSAGWVAGGLVHLGRLVNEPWYVQCGKQVIDYILSLSSSYGWVPEYAQWRPLREEHCETCCIKDIIFAGFELIDAGYDEYWDVIDRFTRNMLSENQVKNADFVGFDNSLADTESMTFRDIASRVVGGYSGGTLPNSMSMKKFRSIAGCCVGTAPQANHLVWKRIVETDQTGVRINLPMDRKHAAATVETDYPNRGELRVRLHKTGSCRIRILPFMQHNLSVEIEGQNGEFRIEDGWISAETLDAGRELRIRHDLATTVRRETVAEQEFDVTWRGNDVVWIAPEGEPLQLFHRDRTKPYVAPETPARMEGCPKGFDATPTVQKK